MSNTYRWGVSFAVMAALTIWGISGSGNTSNGAMGIPPEIVADYVHAVIQADRTIYTTHIVERMQ
jgi:hypothetical protein